MTCLCPDLIIAACCDPSPQPTAKITRLAAVIVEVRESMNLGFAEVWFERSVKISRTTDVITIDA